MVPALIEMDAFNIARDWRLNQYIFCMDMLLTLIMIYIKYCTDFGDTFALISKIALINFLLSLPFAKAMLVEMWRHFVENSSILEFIISKHYKLEQLHVLYCYRHNVLYPI